MCFFYNVMNALFMRWSLHLYCLLWYCSHWYTGVLVMATRHIIDAILYLIFCYCHNISKEQSP